MAPSKKATPAPQNAPKTKKSKKSSSKSKAVWTSSANSSMMKPLPVTAVTSGFTVAGGTGGKEIVYRREFYMDIAGNSWYTFAAKPDSDATSASVVKRVQMYVLPPIVSGPHASNNVMVLAGAPGAEINTGTQVDLFGGTQTMILPSNAPKMMKVLDVDMLKVKRAGVSMIGAINDELVRFAIVNPDTGALSSATVLQAKVVAYYSRTPALTQLVTQQLVGIAAADSAPVPDGGSLTICYDTVIGVENRL